MATTRRIRLPLPAPPSSILVPITPIINRDGRNLCLLGSLAYDPEFFAGLNRQQLSTLPVRTNKTRSYAVQIRRASAPMKKYLLLIPAALGLFALNPTNSKAQDFSFSVGVAPGYYEPGYYNGGYCDPGYGYYYYRRVYYRPARYPGYYYGNGYYRRHHRHHHWQDDD
jgi:hypothetical protein